MLKRLQDELFKVLDYKNPIDSSVRAKKVTIIAKSTQQIDKDCLETLKQINPGAEIKFSSSLDVQDSSAVGITPLHKAAGFGDEVNCTALLNAGADVNFGAKFHSLPPLMSATYKSHENIVRLLVKHKAQINFVADESGTTPLHNATYINHSLPVVQFLVEQKAEVNSISKDGITPLTNAVVFGDEPIVRYLLDHGAQIDLCGESSRTPLIVAVSKGHHSIARLLLEKGAEIEHLSSEKLSALDCAIQSKSITSIFHLLNHGALIRNTEQFRTFLQTQDPQDPEVQFCYGRLCEQEGDLANAERYFQTAINTHQLAPAYRCSGELYEAKGHHVWAFNRYTLAMRGHDFLAPANLVTLAQKELESSHPKISPELIRTVLCEVRFTSHLTSSQWCFLARELQGYPGKVSTALQKQLFAAKKALLLAKNEKERADAHELVSDINKCSVRYRASGGGFFLHPKRHPKPGQTYLNAFSVLSTIKSAELVLEYCGNDDESGVQVDEPAVRNVAVENLMRGRLG